MDEYEFEGVKYHEKLPRIVLGNFPGDVLPSIISHGHNAKSATVEISDMEVGQFATLHLPQPPNEIDILILSDNRPRRDLRFYWQLSWPRGNIADYAACMREVCKHGGVVLLFVGDPAGGITSHTKLASIDEAHTLVPRGRL